jgi:hypothetical protein
VRRTGRAPRRDVRVGLTRHRRPARRAQRLIEDDRTFTEIEIEGAQAIIERVGELLAVLEHGI